MAQQTALNWFLDQLPERIQIALINTSREAVKKAIEMEKQQHKKTWDAAYKAAKDDIVSDKASTFENYYGKSNY